MALIFVNSIPRSTATGIHDWVNDSSGVKMQKVKIGRCNDGIRALYSLSKGGLANYISYTPWIENGVPVAVDSNVLSSLNLSMFDPGINVDLSIYSKSIL